MFKRERVLTNHFLPGLLLIVLGLLLTASANAQTTTSQAHDSEIATNKSAAKKTESNASARSLAPVYTDFRGVRLGMAATDVRENLGHLRNKGDRQDFFVFSESESAQIVYDAQGKVTTISVDYLPKTGEAPTPESVLGEAVTSKPDGSIYQLKRYPEVGYWVAYSRTAGDNPIVTVTMQKM
jgi:hypothetical protein